ncbi:hypothetical protein Ddye_030589 [Dipteronia dyeriana]|uniref:Uncharacterized protein n=1 Tax=Dipteronia dyeriana TaxID=168575 RepID=A0AAD9TGR0_9ROSI|nr:hypothetical protein Ddye_030589 [Dipteronia dyeriana]
MEKGTAREAKFVVVLKLLMDSYQGAKQEFLETRTFGKMVEVITAADASMEKKMAGDEVPLWSSSSECNSVITSQMVIRGVVGDMFLLV